MTFKFSLPAKLSLFTSNNIPSVPSERFQNLFKENCMTSISLCLLFLESSFNIQTIFFLFSNFIDFCFSSYKHAYMSSSVKNKQERKTCFSSTPHFPSLSYQTSWKSRQISCQCFTFQSLLNTTIFILFQCILLNLFSQKYTNAP